MKITAAVLLVVFAVGGATAAYTKYAVCNVQADSKYSGDKGSVAGQVHFRQRLNIGHQSLFGFVTDVAVSLSGFTAAGEGEHGFHIHQNGDLSKGCVSAGGHYNPYGKEHGAPADSNRHIGDLGNVMVVGGSVNVTFSDRELALFGSTNILGRAVVVHAGPDDLGAGGHSDSKTTGHAGARMGCCTIGVADGSFWDNL